MLQKFNPKNQNIQIWVGDRLYPRTTAKISVFDSVVQGGDAVWEGLRVYQEGLFCLEAHLDRLLASAHTLMFDDIPNKNTIRKAIKQTLEANAMTCDTHIRLTLTRGSKITSGMDPRLNQSGSSLIVLAEWKPPVYNNEKGITVITSSVRRNSPIHLDSKIHHNNLLNNILAKIEANHARVDAALMLDNQGFLAELNGTNIFLVKDDRIRTPLSHACLPGITRNLVLQLCKINEIAYTEENISLSEAYNADVVFATGTMGELTPITEIDGRKILNNNTTYLFDEICNLFDNCKPENCTPISKL